MQKVARILFSLPKLSLTLLLLLILYILETILIVIYMGIEKPLGLTLEYMEKLIRYLVSKI